jgi:hypothetical protein
MGGGFADLNLKEEVCCDEIIDDLNEGNDWILTSVYLIGFKKWIELHSEKPVIIVY